MRINQFIKKELSDEEKSFFSFLKRPSSGSLKNIPANSNIKKITSLIERHRLVPFFFYKKEYLAPELQKYATNRFLLNSQRMLIFANEIFLINDILRKNKINPAFLKGPALAYELNNDLASRQMVDIDIFIERKEIDRSHKILLDLGYMPTEIPKTRFKKFILKDNYYFHPEKKVSIEIHYRFFPNKYLDEEYKKTFPSPAKQIEIQNRNLTVLNTEANLVFLILHGSNHQWFRLFWLNDLADFITKKEINWQKIITISDNLGIQNTVFQSIYLTNLFFDIPIPKEIQMISKKERTEKFLIEKAVKAIVSPINENLGTRIMRLNYLLRISKNPTFKLHTFIGGFLRFAGK